jgi:peptide/nickel transport system permease protein
MRFVAKKVAALIVVLFVVSTMSFLLVRALPGNVAINLLGPTATPEAIKQKEHELKLDRPLPAQYIAYMSNVFHGDLDKSLQNGQPITEAIRQRLPVTLELLILSQLLALLIAVPLGILSAYRPEGVVDRVATTTSFGMLAAPAYVSGVFLVYLLAIRFHVFPAIGFQRIGDGIGANLRSVFLPVLTLALPEIASYMRLLRSDMIATLQEDFITMAKAKGLPTSYILLRHALRPSTFSVITVAGLNFGRLIGGTLIVEVLFQQAGIGSFTIQSIFIKDYPAVQGCVLVIAVGYVLANFAVDMSYAAVDPRVRHARAAV